MKNSQRQWDLQKARAEVIREIRNLIYVDDYLDRLDKLQALDSIIGILLQPAYSDEDKMKEVQNLYNLYKNESETNRKILEQEKQSRLDRRLGICKHCGDWCEDFVYDCMIGCKWNNGEGKCELNQAKEVV